MRLITRKRLRDHAGRFPGTRASRARWEGVASAARWSTPSDVRRTFGDVDAVTVASGNTVYVFNIQGNAHRLVAAIHFNRSTVYVLRRLSHAECDRKRWIRDL